MFLIPIYFQIGKLYSQFMMNECLLKSKPHKWFPTVAVDPFLSLSFHYYERNHEAGIPFYFEKNL